MLAYMVIDENLRVYGFVATCQVMCTYVSIDS